MAAVKQAVTTIITAALSRKLSCTLGTNVPNIMMLAK